MTAHVPAVSAAAAAELSSETASPRRGHSAKKSVQRMNFPLKDVEDKHTFVLVILNFLLCTCAILP